VVVWAVRTGTIGYGPNLAQNSELVSRLVLLKMYKIQQTAYALNPHFVASLVLFAATFNLTISDVTCTSGTFSLEDIVPHARRSTESSASWPRTHLSRRLVRPAGCTCIRM